MLGEREMNEKEAREIIENDENENRASKLLNYAGAIKYLEAIEKAKVLEEAVKIGLEYLVAYKENEGIIDNGGEEKIRKAIAQWEKEK